MAKRKQSNPQRNFKRIKRGGQLQSGRVMPAIVAAKRYINDRLEVKELYADFQFPLLITGTVQCLNFVGQGDDISQRGGNRITTKQIQIDYQINQPFYTTGFVALVYDRAPNGNAVSFSDIMATNGGSIPAGICQTNTAQFRDRFVVMWRDDYPNELSTQIYAGAPGTAVTVTKKRHFMKCPEELADVRYGDARAAVPTTGGWYLVFGDIANTGTLNTQLTWSAKYQFTDM